MFCEGIEIKIKYKNIKKIILFVSDYDNSSWIKALSNEQIIFPINKKEIREIIISGLKSEGDNLNVLKITQVIHKSLVNHYSWRIQYLIVELKDRYGLFVYNHID